MFRVLFLVFIILNFSSLTFAEESSEKNSSEVTAEKFLNESEFEENKIRLICALSSLAAYDDEESFLTRSMLNSFGWRIDGLRIENNRADAKAFIISKNFENGKTIKIFVVTGTENLKDVEVDFRLGRVALKNDETSNNFENKIFVHRGFRDYADNILSEGIAEYLLDDLKKNPNETLYLTGHSLGGAVALLSAIRLTDMGIDKNRMKVITFGAPAIGNKTLANEYENKIDLTRIVAGGDVIKKSLSFLGYVHFGKVVQYKENESQNKNPHSMTGYLDSAIRNYYDAGGFEKLPEINPKYKSKTPVYVAPIKIVEKSFRQTDEKYIRAMIRDNFLNCFESVTFAEPNFLEVKKAENFSYEVENYINAAKNSGCKFVLVQMLRSEVVRESKERENCVILEEIIYNLEGMPLSMRHTEATTENLTLIEAVESAEEYLQEEREKIFLNN